MRGKEIEEEVGGNWGKGVRRGGKEDGEQERGGENGMKWKRVRGNCERRRKGVKGELMGV